MKISERQKRRFKQRPKGNIEITLSGESICGKQLRSDQPGKALKGRLRGDWLNNEVARSISLEGSIRFNGMEAA